MCHEPRFRFEWIPEDADEGSWLVVPVRNQAPDWHCDCGTKNDGHEFACVYCGREREDGYE